MLAGLLLCLLSWLLDWGWLAIVFACLTLFVLYFFRDPAREIQAPEKAVLTPADGTILAVEELSEAESPLGRQSLKVSVFMSIFNVHVNRAPVSGVVKKIAYTPGKFLAAHLDKASRFNENNALTLETSDKKLILMVQIAGLIARRIVCWVRVGDHLNAGQRFGLIRFGSRVDLYLPHDTEIVVAPKAKVKAGQTILGYLS